MIKYLQNVYILCQASLQNFSNSNHSQREHVPVMQTSTMTGEERRHMNIRTKYLNVL